MSLLSRVRESEACAVSTCDAARVEGALFCGSLGNGHLGEYWSGRVKQLPDGTWIGVATGPRPRWLERAQAQPNGLARDLTGTLA